MKTKTTPTEPSAVGSTVLLADLDAEARLMRSAQKFGIAFDENRRWGEDVKRLEFTLGAWRELALAALEYAKTVAHSANDKVSDGGPLTPESKQSANPPFAAPTC